MRITIIIVVIGTILFSNCQASENKNAIATSDKSQNKIQSEIFQSVVDSLVNRGVDTAFIKKYIESDNLIFGDRYIKINVTGYLKKTDYSFVTNQNSVTKSKEFMTKNLSTLTAVEEKYGVPKEIITAILWVETKFGTYLGNNHLPSVFFSTALVAEEKYIEINNKVVDEHTNSDSERKELKEKVLQRSKSKTKWAITELAAMSEIEKKYNINFDDINGSWAGAFGIPQFLPSSFLKFAVDGNGDGVIDLFDMEDAIYSVGNYLCKHKWDTFENKKKAVYSYNHSNDYAEQIVKLSEKLKPKQ